MRLMACSVASVRSDVAPRRLRTAGKAPALSVTTRAPLPIRPFSTLHGAFLAEHAATGHHEEGHAHIVDAGDDAHLLLVQAALRILPAALAGGAQHDPCLPLIASSSPTDVPGAGGPGGPRDLATSLRSAPRLEARPCPPDPPESSTPALSLLRVANPSHTRTQSPIFGALSG